MQSVNVSLAGYAPLEGAYCSQNRSLGNRVCLSRCMEGSFPSLGSATRGNQAEPISGVNWVCEQMTWADLI